MAADRNPNWTEEELIIGLAVYFSLRGAPVSSTDLRIREFSRFLGKYSPTPMERRGSNFRNVDGVARRLRNFRNLEGNRHGAQVPRGYREVWERYYLLPGKVSLLADEYRRRLIQRAEQP